MLPPIPTRRCKLPDRELRAVLLPGLVGQVFHVTRYAAYEHIVKSGFIHSNADSSFGESFPGSRNSYGRAKGYVCLFDFRDKPPEAISWGLDCCNFLEANHRGDRIAILLMTAGLFDSLIPASSAFASGGQGKLWIPEVECWYSGSIPLHFVAEVLDVSIVRTPVAKGSLVEAILAANALPHEKHDG